MAVEDPNADLPTAAHPMANPGYGKRSAPGQSPTHERDFAQLPAREAAVAAYLDRLPEGADLSVKTLAKVLPYGQCALRTALRRLSEAGHLRRVKEHVLTEHSARWVTRTYFTRTPRDDAWWAAFRAGGTVPECSGPPARSRAYRALAALGRSDRRMSLSAADCAELEPLVTAWFARDPDPRRLIDALTAGLPPVVHHPAGITRRRLTAKMPPERFPEPAPGLPPAAATGRAGPAAEPPPLRILECTVCRAPGRPDALPGGVCRDCRGDAPPPPPGPTADEIHRRVARLRAAARAPQQPPQAVRPLVPHPADRPAPPSPEPARSEPSPLEPAACPSGGDRT